MSGDYADPATFDRLREALGRRRAPGVLPRDPAEPVRRRGVEPRAIGIGRRGAADRGKTVRPRPRVGAGPQRHAARVVSRGRGLSHRPLPRQGAGAEPAVLPLRQHVPRADLERAIRRPRADHDGRGVRRARARQVLRRGRRASRRLPEPSAAGAVAAGDGAAGVERRRRHRARQGGAPAVHPPAHARRRRARPVSRLSPRNRCRARFARRNLRRRPPRRGQPALERRAHARPRRQMHGGNGHRSAGRLHASGSARCSIRPPRRPTNCAFASVPMCR